MERGFVGGRSAKRAHRRTSTSRAPTLTVPAAWAARQALDAVGQGRRRGEVLREIAADKAAFKRWQAELQRQRVPISARRLALLVVEHYTSQLSAAATAGDRVQQSRRQLAALLQRAAPPDNVTVVELPLAPSSGRTLAEFLSPAGAQQRRRDPDLGSVAAMIAGWHINDPGVPAVICPETARERIADERGGWPDPAFVPGLIHTRVMPTFVSNPSHHPWWFQEERWFSNSEAAAAMGFGESSSAQRCIGEAGGLTARQALMALGNSGHVPAGRLMWHRGFSRLRAGAKQRLARARASEGGVKLASLYAGGVDFLAAGLEEATEGGMTYALAAEAEPRLQTALLAGWQARGLEEASVFDDAASLDEDTTPDFDVAALSPECCELAQQNRLRQGARAAAGLANFTRALKFVVSKAPLVIIVENVDSPEANVAISGVVGVHDGYEWERVPCCPWKHLGWPMRRPRSFWIGTIKA